MSINFEEILKELEYRVEHGIIDLTKEEQVTTLVEILRENKVSDANEMAQKARVLFSYLMEAVKKGDAGLEAAMDFFKGKKYKNSKGNEVAFSTAIGYNDPSDLAHNSAMDDLESFLNANKGKYGSIEKVKKSEPEEPKANVFGKDKGGAVFTPKSEPTDISSKPSEKPKSTSKSAESTEKPKPSRRINPDEGQTVKEVNEKEIDDVISKYVSTGEPTPDEMGDIKEGYSEQDMAEGYSDDEFYSKEHQSLLSKEKIKIRQAPYKMDKSTRQQLKEAGFPEKYIKFLERCINTQVKGKKPSVTELIKQGGAGQIQSQFGEVMAMAFMSIRDPKIRRQMADVLNNEINKSSDEFGGGKASPIATKDWVEASLSHAESFDSAMDEKYGKGSWKFEGASWDIKDDVESMGLDYKNKGFSTDVLLRIQPLKNGKPSGPALAQKCSLKKDEAIFFFNGSINEVNNFVLNFLDERGRKKVRGYESIISKSKSKIPEEKAAALAAAEKITGLTGNKAIQQLKNSADGLREDAFNKAPKDIQKSITLIREFPNKQINSAVTMAKKINTDYKNVNKIVDNTKDIGEEDKDFAKMSYEIVKKCKGSKDSALCIKEQLEKKGEDSGDERVCKVSVMAAKVAIAAGDKSAKNMLDSHYNLANEAGNALMKTLPDSPELMGGLMQKLAEAFPMKTCMNGEEFMLIDGMKVTQKTLQTVFGVSSYDELQEGLKLKKMPNGEFVLVYGAKTKSGTDIPIGIVGARQKGKGYVGSVGFEIACSDEFAHSIAEANDKNGDMSISNKKALARIGSTLEKRKNKKK